MPSFADILQLFGAVALVAIMLIVVRWRHRQKAEHDERYALEHTCEHLRRVVEHLQANGHAIRRVGQMGPEMPLEVHVQPAFDPNRVYAELQLEPPVYVSERGVLFCKEDWCEVHPVKG